MLNVRLAVLTEVRLLLLVLRMRRTCHNDLHLFLLLWVTDILSTSVSSRGQVKGNGFPFKRQLCQYLCQNSIGDIRAERTYQISKVTCVKLDGRHKPHMSEVQEGHSI